MPSRNVTRNFIKRIMDKDASGSFIDSSAARDGYFTNFDVLPSITGAVVAGKNDLVEADDDTNAVVLTRADKGGIRLTLANADGDVGGIRGSTLGGSFAFKISGDTKPYFRTKVMLTNVTTAFYSTGYDENVGDAPDPDPEAGAGDGIAFVADPTGEGAGTAGSANWLVQVKVNGVDAAPTDSGVVLVVDQDYDLLLTMTATRTVLCYIDNVLVHTTAALTDNDTVKCYAAMEATTTDEPAFEARYWMMNKVTGTA